MANSNLDALQLNGNSAADSAGLILGSGTAASPATTATADKNFIEFRVENTATSGDNRGMYLREYLAGAGGGGEALRVFTTVDDVAAGTAHGMHCSLNFDTSGSVTGQGIAGRFTLHMPSTALSASNVTYAAIQAEIWSDGATSDPAGNLLSAIRVVNGGNTTGAADVDDDVIDRPTENIFVQQDLRHSRIPQVKKLSTQLVANVLGLPNGKEILSNVVKLQLDLIEEFSGKLNDADKIQWVRDHLNEDQQVDLINLSDSGS